MTTPAASEEPAEIAAAAYSFRARPFGGEVKLALCGGALEIDDGRRTTSVPLAGVEAVRLTCELRNNILTRGYRARLSFRRSGVTISSQSARSMIETVNQKEAYRAFLGALLPAIAAANPACRFLAGQPTLLWAAQAIVTAALVVGAILAMASAVQRLSLWAFLALAAGAAGFLWLLVDMAWRNRPRPFRPEAPPPELLP